MLNVTFILFFLGFIGDVFETRLNAPKKKMKKGIIITINHILLNMNMTTGTLLNSH